jgi:GT2 family glycosyltransferase
MPQKMIEKNIKPLISVVLATKGKKTVFLEKCIKSLEKQTFQRFEIILIYSSYPRALSPLFEDFEVSTLKEEGSTLGAARNLGIKHAEGEIVAFIDDDAEATEDWLAQIYSIFDSNPLVVCVGGPTMTPSEESKKNPRFVEGSYTGSQTGGKVVLDRFAVGKIAGCNVAYRKKIFEKIGYLNEFLKSGEDWEFHIRLVESKCSIRYDPKVKVWHHRQGLKHAFLNASNMAPFYISWKTFKYSRYESLFASFYFLNILFLLLLITLFVSRFIFFVVLGLSLLGYFLLIAINSIFDRRLLYYPMAVLFNLAALTGFYYGVLRQITGKLYSLLMANKSRERESLL